jgi:beta-glucuronidase
MDGYFMNGYQAPGGEPLDYDFQKSPVLHVPRDWNTQRESLFFYEGPIWYEKDFSYQRKPGTRVFFHVGAANYRSYVWVNGQKVCEHEGGFTPFDCEVTGLRKDGRNFVVMAVDNTRLADGIPTLQTDRWNYGGLTRDVSLVEVPEQFIDDFATPEAQTTVRIPELNVNEAAKVGTDGRATFQFEVSKLEPWSPEHPRLYRLHIHAGQDDLEDEMGFRTVECTAPRFSSMARPFFCELSPFMARRRTAPAVRTTMRTRTRCLAGSTSWVETMSVSRTTHTTSG